MEDPAKSCAACGKGGDSLKTCNGCKEVKYCNVACQKAHRPNHKKECQIRAKQLLDYELFKQPPHREDCPICLLRLPSGGGTCYQICCGKTICDGCVCMMQDRTNTCPMCRQQCFRSNSKTVEMVKERMEAGDAQAYCMMAGDYDSGAMGLPKDRKKALELWLKAGELGYAMGYYNAACSYQEGTGVEKSMKKAWKYYTLAAIGGHERSRKNLGFRELQEGNLALATCHFMIAAKAGDDEAMKVITDIFKKGAISKDTYSTVLHAYKEAQDEIKSDNREKAIKIRLDEQPYVSRMGRI